MPIATSLLLAVAPPLPPASAVSGATWDTAGTGPALVFSDNNLGLACTSSAWHETRATTPVAGGRAYWEISIRQNGSIMIGLARDTHAPFFPGSDAESWGLYANSGYLYHSGYAGTFPLVTSAGDVVGVSYDADAGTLAFALNGIDKGLAFAGITPPATPAIAVADGAETLANFGATPFAYS